MYGQENERCHDGSVTMNGFWCNIKMNVVSKHSASAAGINKDLELGLDIFKWVLMTFFFNSYKQMKVIKVF